MKLLSEFKIFLVRGSVIDVAIAVVIGAAFGAVVTALVQDMITPLIAAIGGQPDFSTLHFTINSSTFLYGDFINKVLSFIVVAAIVFFFVIVPLNALLARLYAGKRKCLECLSDIPVAATRCSFCTTQVPPTV